MGLSARLLLRLCLPACALLLTLSLVHWWTRSAEVLDETRTRLQAAAHHVAEAAEDEVAALDEHLDALSDFPLVARDEGATITTRARLAARQLLARRPECLALEFYALDGTPLGAIDPSGERPLPPPARDARWFAPALASARRISWELAQDPAARGAGVADVIVLDSDARGVARLARLLRQAPPDSVAAEQDVVASVLIDFARFVQPAIEAETRATGPASARIECRGGQTQLRFGAPPVGGELVAAGAELPCIEGRVEYSMPVAWATAGLLADQLRIFGLFFLLVLLMTVLLWRGLKHDVLAPVGSLMQVVSAFEADRLPPPRRKQHHAPLELSELETALRSAIAGSTAARAEVERLNRSLEERVAARTAALQSANEALTRARDEAEQATAAKTRFAAHLSHEVRTPLNAIVGMTELLAETALDAEQSDSVETIRQAGQTLLATVNQVLDLSKGEVGKLTLAHVDFDAGLLLEDVAEIVSGLAHAKDLRLLVDIPAGLPTRVRGDEGRLRQVLINYAGNAIKFTDAGRVRLALRSLGERDGRARLRFEVSDTGIGISDEDSRRLFQPFAQLEDGRPQRPTGTGLGLAISRQFIELMGGTTGVRSAPGAGSTFWCEVELPLQEAPRRATELRWELANQRLLLVDPDEEARTLLAERLRRLGCTVETAADASAGLRAAHEGFLRGQPHALALVDQHVSAAGVEEFVAGLRADPATAATPVLVLASGSAARRPSGPASSGARVLPQPARAAVLQSTLLAALNTGPAPRRPQPAAAVARVEAPDADSTRRRLLVAEDNPVNQLVTRRLLESLGYRADFVADGRAAVQAWRRGGYAAIFMDCRMPVLDGPGATREIRALEGDGSRTPIIALTAGAGSNDRAEALAAGMDDFLTKPVGRAELSGALNQWLGRLPRPSPAPETA